MTAEDREDDSYLDQLGRTRRPLLGEWDDPTEFRAWVDPDIDKWSSHGRILHGQDYHR